MKLAIVIAIAMMVFQSGASSVVADAIGSRDARLWTTIANAINNVNNR